MSDSGQYQYYEAEREIPVRDTSGRGQSPSGRLTPGGRVSQGRGPTVSAGARAPSKYKLAKDQLNIQVGIYANSETQIILHIQESSMGGMWVASPTFLQVEN